MTVYYHRSSLPSPNEVRVMEVQVGVMGNKMLVDDKGVSEGQGQCEGQGGGGCQTRA